PPLSAWVGSRCQFCYPGTRSHTVRDPAYVAGRQHPWRQPPSSYIIDAEAQSVQSRDNPGARSRSDSVVQQSGGSVCFLLEVAADSYQIRTIAEVTATLSSSLLRRLSVSL